MPVRRRCSPVTVAEASTGSAAADAVFAWLAGIGALILAMSAVGVGLRRLGRIARAAEQVRDDFMGTPARPGVAERPGVMVRMASLEKGQADMATRFGARLEGLERLLGQA